MADRTEVSPPHSFVIVVTGAQFGEVFDLVPGRELTLGRGPAASAVLHEETIAPRHAQVTPGAREARLVDLGSDTGTFVDGVRVQDVVLANGARFRLGPHTTLKFVAPGDVEAEYQLRLAQAAQHEPLTGLYNRRHFLERLAAELAAAQRHGRSLSLLAVDIDELRRVNESHGPLAGDEALKMVAFVLQGAIRKEDVVARYGGEEFVVLARETGVTGAKALAERIRKAVERSRSSYAGDEIALTVSIGVTVSIGFTDFEDGCSEQHMLDAAERALQRAKAAGRNTVAAEPTRAE
jgi:two-component system, cell cycle response regulator